MPFNLTNHSENQANSESVSQQNLIDVNYNSIVLRNKHFVAFVGRICVKSTVIFTDNLPIYSHHQI